MISSYLQEIDIGKKGDSNRGSVADIGMSGRLNFEEQRE